MSVVPIIRTCQWCLKYFNYIFNVLRLKFALQIIIIKVSEIKVEGLDEKNNLKLKNDLKFLKFNNLFYIDKFTISRIINSNNLVEDFSVFKYYPSAIEISIKKTKFLAKVKQNGFDYFLGSNGKLIKDDYFNTEVPVIFGNFKNENFFALKKSINDSGFDYNKIKKLFFFKSGRWDIETSSGLLIKLPQKNVTDSLKLAIKFQKNDTQNVISKIDLRQQNQIIIDEK